MCKIIVQKCGFCVADVKIATIELSASEWEMGRDGCIRWLRWESGDDAFLDILQCQIIASPSLAKGGLLGFHRIILDFNLGLDFRISLFNEREPAASV